MPVREPRTAEAKAHKQRVAAVIESVAKVRTFLTHIELRAHVSGSRQHAGSDFACSLNTPGVLCCILIEMLFSF